MRPVDKGKAPRTYTRYGDALPDLEERLGILCSYCEQMLGVGLAVEHVAPKSLEPDLELDWDNFLIGCPNCNSIKLNQPTTVAGFLWPDRDNTLRAFEYEKGGFVRVSQHLPDSAKTKAKALMELVGLDRHIAQGWPKPARRDRRYQLRERAWALAEALQRKFPVPDDEDRDLIAQAALTAGFFSVWMQVFQNDPALRVRLIRAFVGTAPACFDKSGQAVARPGGRC